LLFDVACCNISKNVQNYYYIPSRKTHIVNLEIHFDGCHSVKMYHREITVDPDEEAVDKGEEEEPPDDVPRLYPFCVVALLLITE